MNEEVKADMYIEAFVERSEWRWRFYQSDPGLIHIEYQEWNDREKKWEPHSSGEVSFNAEDVPAVCAALNAVKSTGC